MFAGNFPNGYGGDGNWEIDVGVNLFMGWLRWYFSKKKVALKRIYEGRYEGLFFS